MKQQLCGECFVSYGLWPINGHLSTLGVFYDLAHIEWAFIEKDARSPQGAKRIPGSRDAHSAGTKFDVIKFRDSGASIGLWHCRIVEDENHIKPNATLLNGAGQKFFD